MALEALEEVKAQLISPVMIFFINIPFYLGCFIKEPVLGWPVDLQLVWCVLTVRAKNGKSSWLAMTSKFFSNPPSFLGGYLNNNEYIYRRFQILF